MQREKLLGSLLPYQNKTALIVSEQSTGDIIKSILNAHDKHASDYKKIAYHFKGSTPKQTAKNIFDFLKSNVKYFIEPSEKQMIKSPAAIVAQGFGDCKSYSLFSSGIARALGLPYAFRFSSYKKYDPQPGHVFTVINPGSQNEIWIDPVLPKFNYKKPYNFAIDKIPHNMALYKVSGVSDAEISGLKDIVKKVGQTLKKGVTLVAKVAASPARNAFLLLVDINFTGLATKLSAAWKKNASGLTNVWQGLGGNINALKKAWEKGEKKKRILGTEGDKFNAAIGVAPAAAAVAAAPIILKIVDFLKKIGVDPADLVDIAKKGISEKAKQLIAEKVTPEIAQEYEYETNADEVLQTDQKPATDKTTPGINTGLIVGAVVIGGVLYFMTMKKRK